MMGDRWTASLGALFLLTACGGGRETGAPAATSRDTSAAVSDTAAAPQAQPESITASRDTTTSVARTPAPKPAPAATPAPKPAAPKKPAPTPKPAEPDTVAAAAAQPDTLDGAETKPDTVAAASPSAETPLRDAYHQAPRDTVSAEVYDGWKQYNLNCARCHGEDVLGTTIAPHLLVSVRPGGPVATKEAFIQTVCAGRPEKGMPSWCALGMEMDKINAIHAYVKGRSEGKIAPGRPARRE